MTKPEEPAPPKDPAVIEAEAERLLKAWETPKGWRYWSAVNNSEVGKWYTLTSFFFMLFGGVLALLMRTQLAVPDNDFLSGALYDQVFTLHGSVMMFLFAVPILEAVAILLLPEILAARDLPFPRLSAFGYWCFLIGGVFVCGSIFFGAGPTGGWFMYPPLSSEERTGGIGVDIWLLGLSFIEIASIAAAVELIIGVLKCRPPGMRINLMPLYAWYILVVGGMILFAFPPLIAGDLLLEMERAFDWPFFDPERGGDPLLWQHLFWVFGHPEVYIIFLPAIAVVAMIVPTFAQRPIYGYTWIVLAAVGTGFISFGLWVHHMYATGLPNISLGFFSAASEAVAIPTGVQIFAFIATMLLGRVIFSVPMLFVSGALAIFVAGGLTGVMVALVPFDWQAHDSYFIVAHLHYTLLGGMLFPMFAGLYYYFPAVTARKLSDRWGRIAFWLMFIGFNVTFLPMHLTGLLGMPRRVFTYPAGFGWDGLNLVSTVGAFVFAAGVVVVAVDLLRPRGREPYCPRNPWNAGTLEWLTEMPGKPWGSRSVPEIDSRYPLWEEEDVMRLVDEGRYFLPDAEEGKRETLVTTTIDAEPIQCLRVPGPSFLPMIAAIFVGGAFIFSTFSWYWMAIASGLAGVVAILVWLWTGTAVVPEKPAKPVGLGVTLPLYASGPNSVGWWAMFITMLGDAAAFAGVVFGYFFFWTIHDDFPPDPHVGPGLPWPAVGLALAFAGWVLTLAARRANRRHGRYPTRLLLAAAAAISATAIGAVLYAPWVAGLEPTAHAYPATVWVLAIWVALHLGVGVIAQLYCLARSLAGRMNGTHDIDISNTALYWHFMAATAAVHFGVVALFPLAA